MKLDTPRRGYKSIIAVIMAAVIVICAVVILGDFSPHGSFTLTVLFTGDLHGNMEVMPYYQTIINQAQRDSQVLLLDCGDLFEGGANQEKGGQSEAVVLSAMKYDAMTLGNNEFWCTENTYDACDAKLEALSKSVTFPLLCANVKKNGEYLPGVKPYTIVNKGGLKIAIIGLTTDKMNNNEVENKTISDPVVTLEQINAELEGVVDVKIVLSHCEQEQNEAFKSVHAVIAGHIHEPTAEIKADTQYKSSIPVVRAGGKKNGNLGKLMLELKENDDGSWGVENYSFELLPPKGLPDQKILSIVSGIK